MESFKHLILFILLSNFVDSDIDIINRINYGFIFEKLGEISFANDKWLHTFTVKFPPKIGLSVNMRSMCVMYDTHRKNITHPCGARRMLREMLQDLYTEHEKVYDKYAYWTSKVIPEAPGPSSRCKRAFLDISSPLKSLFGVAKASDVARISDSVDELHKLQEEEHKTFTASIDKLTSAVKASNKRIDALHNGVNANHQAITSIAINVNELGDLMKVYFTKWYPLLTRTAHTLTQLQNSYQRFLTGLNDLVAGVLSPTLISPEDLGHMIRNLGRALRERSRSFELAIIEPYDIYRLKDYTVLKRNNTFYITLRLPIQVKLQSMNLYKIITVPIPLHDASDHVSMVKQTRELIAISPDVRYHAYLNIVDLNACFGNVRKVCNLIPKQIPSHVKTCELAVFKDEKYHIRKLCEYVLHEDALRPQAYIIAEDMYLLINITSYFVTCDGKQTVYPGCHFCVQHIDSHCHRCSVEIEDIKFPEYFATCKKTAATTSRTHPMNLMVGMEFLTKRVIDQMLGNTFAKEPHNFSLPKLRIYNSKFEKYMCKERKAEVHLQKSLTQLKALKPVYRDLADKLDEVHTERLSDPFTLRYQIMIYSLIGAQACNMAITLYLYYRHNIMLAMLSSCQNKAVGNYIYNVEQSTVPEMSNFEQILVENSHILTLTTAIIVGTVVIIACFSACRKCHFLPFFLTNECRAIRTDPTKIVFSIWNYAECMFLFWQTIDLPPHKVQYPKINNITKLYVRTVFPLLLYRVDLSQQRGHLKSDNGTIIQFDDYIHVSYFTAKRLRTFLSDTYWVSVYIGRHNVFFPVKRKQCPPVSSTPSPSAPSARFVPEESMISLALLGGQVPSPDKLYPRLAGQYIEPDGDLPPYSPSTSKM